MFDLLGIDWGTKKTGMALGSTTTGLTIPFNKMVETKDLYLALDEVFKSKKIHTVVVGIPTNFYLQNTLISSKINEFIEEFESNYPEIGVVTVNERGSSKEAEYLITKSVNTDVKLSSKKPFIDNVAAQQILEYYLSSLQK